LGTGIGRVTLLQSLIFLASCLRAGRKPDAPPRLRGPSSARIALGIKGGGAYHRGLAFAADRRQRMEIRVKRDADASVGSGTFQDFNILSAAHANFGHMDNVPTGLREQRRGRTW
jgi:hypothetical protein